MDFGLLSTGINYQPIQIIRVNRYPEEVIEEFPVSTSQAMMLKDGEVLYSRKFFNSIKDKVVEFNSNTTSMDYLSKMIRRKSLEGFAFKPIDVTYEKYSWEWDEDWKPY